MARMTYELGLTDARDEVVIELSEDGRPLAQLILDSGGVHDLIRLLAQCRAKMTEEVPGDLDPGARLEVTEQPAWLVPDQQSGSTGTVLALRHPGMGWLGFVLEPERARQIGQALLDHSQR